MAWSFRPRRDGHSSATPVARRLKQPTRTAPRTMVGAFAPVPSLFGFAPGGVCRAASVAGSAVRSYRTVSPLPRQIHNAPRRSVLCGTVPGVAPAGRYPAPSVLEPGLSSPAAFRHWCGAAVQPTDRLGMGAHGAPVKGRRVRPLTPQAASDHGQRHASALSAAARIRGRPGAFAAFPASKRRSRRRLSPGGSGAGMR